MEGNLDKGVEWDNVGQVAEGKGLNQLEGSKGHPVGQPHRMLTLLSSLNSLHRHECRIPKDDHGDKHLSSNLKQPVSSQYGSSTDNEAGLGNTDLTLKFEHHGVLAQSIVEGAFVGG